MKLTPFYPDNIKPARPGIYQRRYPSGTLLYCFFDGRIWFAGAHCSQHAKAMPDISATQYLPWRGVCK